MATPIRILLADDHALLRQGTVALLDREPAFEVIGEAENGLQAVELTLRLKPDVVVMDVRMPVLSGIEATKRIREAAPEVRVLVLTAHEDDQYVFALLQEGASGYLLKSAPVEALIRAIHQVHQGLTPLDPTIAHKVVMKASSQTPRQPDAEASPMERLTPRELEVLRLLAHGLSNRAIAQELFISDRTVQAHLTNIFGKMQVNSRFEAVLSAIRKGWLSLEG